MYLRDGDEIVEIIFIRMKLKYEKAGKALNNFDLILAKNFYP